MARNFPFRRPSGASFFQTEPRQNLIDGPRLNRDAERLDRLFRRCSETSAGFAGTLPATPISFAGVPFATLANQFGCAVRCPQNHFRIDPAFRSDNSRRSGKLKLRAVRRTPAGKK